MIPATHNPSLKDGNCEGNQRNPDPAVANRQSASYSGNHLKLAISDPVSCSDSNAMIVSEISKLEKFDWRDKSIKFPLPHIANRQYFHTHTKSSAVSFPDTGIANIQYFPNRQFPTFSNTSQCFR